MATPRNLSSARACIGGFPASGVMDVRSMGQILGRAAMVTAPAVTTVAAGTQCSLFLDDFGQAATGNLPLTNADATMFGGRVQQGEITTIFGCQFSINEFQPIPIPIPGGPGFSVVASTPAIIQDVMANISVRLNLKGQTFNVGNLQTYPSGQGCSGLARNGGANTFSFRFPDALPVQITSNDQMFITLTAERQFNLTAANNGVLFTCNMPSTTAVSLSNLSGA